MKKPFTLRDEIDGKEPPMYHGTCFACGREYSNPKGMGERTCAHCGWVNHPHDRPSPARRINQLTD